eukprot:CAMPEP_0206403402 /NCGR_PEP_ID=MMETSP0294-20121207/27660_1 /ASSEMBLY_ACC=CAM_ASM_000327 /TAXON_ID=39354 /ORGANISM="Heterosigma akashiwo, Strain CCMP2393" /LENGTH=53 /DNA_ID=CAMNT_0053860919 /DNA_START=82 /DNA_END=239 /DNA_ORIENTATION=+
MAEQNTLGDSVDEVENKPSGGDKKKTITSTGLNAGATPFVFNPAASSWKPPNA